MPVRIFTSVDLPAPFSPMRAVTWPECRSSWPSVRARVPPKDLEMFRRVRIGWDRGPEVRLEEEPVMGLATGSEPGPWIGLDMVILPACAARWPALRTRAQTERHLTCRRRTVSPSA